MNSKGNQSVSFSIDKSIGVLAEYKTGWKKELNLVSWNEANSKYDIRDWDPDHAHMSRGITLRKEEAKALMELLLKENLEEDLSADLPKDLPKDFAEEAAMSEEVFADSPN